MDSEHIIRNTIAWNERRFERTEALVDKLPVCPVRDELRADAKRLAHNIETLKARLEV